MISSLYRKRESGQAAVELAITLPVILILIIIASQLMFYLVLCARFDNLAAEVVRVYGAEAEQGTSESARCKSIASKLTQYMDTSATIKVNVEVKNEKGNTDTSSDGNFAFFPTIRTYTCSLAFTPWPAAGTEIDIAGSSTGFIPVLRHKKSFVVGVFGLE